jgi:hypothetical protein
VSKVLVSYQKKKRAHAGFVWFRTGANTNRFGRHEPSIEPPRKSLPVLGSPVSFGSMFEDGIVPNVERIMSPFDCDIVSDWFQ